MHRDSPFLISLVVRTPRRRQSAFADRQKIPKVCLLTDHIVMLFGRFTSRLIEVTLQGEIFGIYFWVVRIAAPEAGTSWIGQAVFFGNLSRDVGRYNDSELASGNGKAVSRNIFLNFAASRNSVQLDYVVAATENAGWNLT